MITTIKTKSPKSHLEVCTLINMHESLIIESKILNGEYYGMFVIDTDPETVDSFIIASETSVCWESNS